MDLHEPCDSVEVIDVYRPARPVVAGLTFTVAVAGGWLAIREACQWPGAPYNVRELFPVRHTWVYQLAFSVLLVWIGFGPAWVGRLLLDRPRLAKAVPVFSAIIGLVSWMLLRFAVTTESLGDIVGAPVLGWGGDWEMMARFIGLQAVVSLVLIVSAVTVGGVSRFGFSGGLKRGAIIGLWALPWLCLAWVSVMDWTRTDNLVELIRHEPFKWAGPICLTAGVAMVGLHCEALALMISRRGRRANVIAVLAAIVAAPFVIAGTWGMLYLGLKPSVEKYELTFPAVRFLLAPDRKAQLSWAELFMRWSGVQLAATVGLTCGAAAATMFRSVARTSAVAPQSSEAPSRAGRALLVMMLVYVGLLFYGSLVPFDFRWITFEQAWEAFWHTDLLIEARWGKSDVVTNIAMAVPLTFLAIGAWSRENTRRGLWYKAPLVFVGSVAISACLEFSQIFTANRIASVHDLISQGIGGAIGLVVWGVAGSALCGWVRDLFIARSQADLAHRVLWTYLGLLVLYQLLPLNPTISFSQIMARYRHGMINFVPFCDHVMMGFYALVMKMATYLPIGFLVAFRTDRWLRRIARAVFCGLGLSLLIEILQIFIASRIATSTDIVLGTIGAALGGVLGCLAAGRTSDRRLRWWQSYGAWVKLAASLGWMLVMAWRRWYPFEFHWPVADVVKRIHRIFATPVFDIFRSAGPMDALARVGEEFIALLVFGILLQGLLARSGGLRRFAVGIAAAVVGLVMEAGRLCFPVYGPDLTVALAGLAGCAASVWAYPRFVALFLTVDDDYSLSRDSGDAEDIKEAEKLAEMNVDKRQ